MILKNHIHQNLEHDLCMNMENTNTSNSMGCKVDSSILAHTYGFLLESPPQVATTILHAKERDFHNRNEITIHVS